MIINRVKLTTAILVAVVLTVWLSMASIFSHSGLAQQYTVPPPHAGTYTHEFRETTESGSSLPEWQPPTTVIIASANDASGLLTEVRWFSHQSLGDFGAFISITIDGVTQEFPLSYGHMNQRDVGKVYQDNGVFRLPLGDGIRFKRSFQVKFFGRPLSPGQVAGGANMKDAFVAWRLD
jgi:hypothetical protein